MKSQRLPLLIALAATLALAAALAPGAFAQSTVPNFISYQGKITDASGTPVGNTAPVNRTVIFRIWDSPTATAAANRLYSEQQNVTISAGEFSVLIGAGTPVSGETANAFTTFSSAVFAGATRYLGVTVDDGDLNLTNDPESSPRQQMVSTAFALRAQTAETVANGSITAAAFANGSIGPIALGNASVTIDKLATDSVSTSALGNATVTSAKLAANSVLTAALGNATVTAEKLAPLSVGTTALGNASVTSLKLADGSVTLGKLAADSVPTTALGNASVTAEKLAPSSVGTTALGNASVTSEKLVDGSATLAKLASNSVDSSKIVDGTIALADMTASVRDVLPKPRHVYNQAVQTSDQLGWVLIPIDLGDLGFDDDGCRVNIIAVHKTTALSMLTSEMHLWVQQEGFVSTNAATITNRRWVSSRWNNSASVNYQSVVLPPSVSEFTRVAQVTREGNEWISFYNYYPGTLRGGTNPENSANIDQGPTITLDIASVVTGTNKLTFFTKNPHAIQVGAHTTTLAPYTVTLANITGTGPSAIGTFTVTAVPDRMSFEITLAGASGTYSPGTNGTVTYQPKFNAYRIWAAVHPNVSARIIVSDR